MRESDYQTAGGSTYPVNADAVRGHLMVVATGGLADQLEPSFGDSPDAMNADYSIIAFDPVPAPGAATASDRVRSRLKALVDHASSFEIVGVTADTVWSDGTTIEAQPAFALGSTVFYDTTNCDGNGRWIRGTNDNQECTNSVGMLYHELAHAFRGHGAGDIATEEAEAIDDENDLREAQSLVLRDRDRLEGGCNCPGGDCCIVASVAYGSPFAPDIQRLRRIRDYTLRASPIGAAFFDALNREYYAFSIDICRIMVRSHAAHQNVERGLVRPLAAALTVLQTCAEHSDDPACVGQIIRQIRQHDGNDAGALDSGAALLGELVEGRLPVRAGQAVDPQTREILSILAHRLPRSPHVRWGVVQPLQLWVSLLTRFDAQADTELVGRWMLDAYETWIRTIPIVDPQDTESAPDADRPNQVDAFVATIASCDRMRLRIAAVLAERIRAMSGGRR
jgi:hypothetical protein